MERETIKIFHHEDIRKILRQTSQNHTNYLLEGGFVYDADVEIVHGEHLSIGVFGTRPAVLDGGLSDGIRITDCVDVEISGLIVKGAGWNENRKGVGVRIETSQEIVIRNVEVFGFQQAGIGAGSSTDVTVEGCYAHNNGYCGITSFTGQKQNRNLWIRHCKALDNGGDPTMKKNHSGSGIAIFHAENVAVEYCETAGNGWAQRQENINGPVGIWCACDVKNVTFRKNISRHNRTQPGGVDGDGFDIDGGVSDGWMEYNYSYENEGSGYLFCEYGSGLDYKNNHMKYCISLMDAQRVPRQGSLQYYGPEGLSLQNSMTRDCLLVPSPGRHCIVNNEVGKDCNGIDASDCVLVQSDVPAVSTTENRFTSIHDNHILSDKALYDRIQHAVPRLTNPRTLDELPVFRYLENKTLADAIRHHSISELFGMTEKVLPDRGTLQFVYDLNGRDFEGSDILQNAAICYDSIKPGYALKLDGCPAKVQFSCPALESGKHYIAVLTARIQSPDTEACFYIKEKERCVNSLMLTGTVSAYHSFILPFTSKNNSVDIGIAQSGGEGAVYCEKISLYRMPDTNQSSPETGGLSAYSTTGDVYADASAGDGDARTSHPSIFLNGQGSALTGYHRIQGKNPASDEQASRSMTLSAVIRTGECDGLLFIEYKERRETLLLSSRKQHYKIEFAIDPEDTSAENPADINDGWDFIRYGVMNKGGKNNGKIEIVKIELK